MSITEKCKNNKEANINIDSGANLSLTIVKGYLLIFFFKVAIITSALNWNDSNFCKNEYYKFSHNSI